MAARIVHHAAAERLLKCVEFKNSGDLTKESPAFFLRAKWRMNSLKLPLTAA